MSNDKENIIRDQRTIDATKKNLMGPSGKLGIILQAFGSPIIKQGTGLVDIGYLDNPYDDYVHTDYSPTLSEQQGPIMHRDEILDLNDENIYNEGLIFDGLSRGLHVEIVYWHNINEIKVSYKGFEVYKEVAGELDGYAPFPDWENLIEKLYKSAKEKMKKIKKEQDAEMAEKIEIKKKDFWQKLRLKWGEIN